MRWPSYFILVYVALGLQQALSGVADVYGAWLNLGLLSAVFVALNASRHAALPACFFIGLVQDLLSAPHPLGAFAVAYGLVGWCVAHVQDVVFREHPFTHLTVTFLGGLITWCVLAANGWVYGWLHQGDTYAGQSLGRLMGSALFTALISPLLLGALQRLRKSFGFRPGRPSLQGRLTKGMGGR